MNCIDVLETACRKMMNLHFEAFIAALAHAEVPLIFWLAMIYTATWCFLWFVYFANPVSLKMQQQKTGNSVPHSIKRSKKIRVVLFFGALVPKITHVANYLSGLLCKFQSTYCGQFGTETRMANVIWLQCILMEQSGVSGRFVKKLLWPT